MGKFITDDPNAFEVFVDMYVYASKDITVLSYMVDAGAIVEMDEEMMPFMNSHDVTLEEAEIAAAHLTVSVWARMLLGRRFDLYTALALGERSMFAPFKPFSQGYENYNKALSVYEYDWKLQAGRHDEMNYGPEMQEIIEIDDDSDCMEEDQGFGGEFMVIGGEDAVESDLEIIAISEDGDDMGGESAKDESSKKDRSSNGGSSDEIEEDSVCPESSNELEGHGWYDPAEVKRHARLDNLVEKVCDELRLKYGKDQARVNELWEEFAEMAGEQGKREDDAESTNQEVPTVKTTRASSGSSEGGLLHPC